MRAMVSYADAAPSSRTTETDDDEKLVAALHARDGAAAAELFRRYAPHVRRVLMRVLGPRNDLADLLHDVFVQALTSVHDLRESGALKGWLTTVTVFVARGCIRRQQRRRWLHFLPSEEVPEVATEQPDDEASEAVRALYAVLESLPIDERIPLTLRLVDGMDVADVAVACGVSMSTIKRRLARAEGRFYRLGERSPALRAWIEGGRR